MLIFDSSIEQLRDSWVLFWPHNRTELPASAGQLSHLQLVYLLLGLSIYFDLLALA